MRLKFFFLAILIFLSAAPHLDAHGFCTGTTVKTPRGHSNIENIDIGTTVLSYHADQGYSEQPVIAIKKTKVSSFIRLWFKDHYLDTSPDQLFYLAHEKKWIKAENLTKEHILLKNTTEELVIDDIEIINQEIELYSITVKKHHTFYVTEQNIYVHNVVPAVILGFSFAFGGGSVEFVGATIGVGVLGAILGFKICKGKSKPKIPKLKVGKINKASPRSSNRPTQPTINPTTSITKVNPPKPGCGTIQIPKAEDHILITPIVQPDRQPNKGCFHPIPAPEIKPSCGGIKPVQPPTLILTQETEQGAQSQKPDQTAVPSAENAGEQDAEKPKADRDDRFQEAVEYGTTKAKLNHFFGENIQHDHGFAEILNEIDKDKDKAKIKFVEEVINQLIELDSLPENGKFGDIQLSIFGHETMVRGFVQNGSIKIGTMFSKV